MSPRLILPPPVDAFTLPMQSLDLHVSAARLDHDALPAGEHNHVASAGLGLDLPFHRPDRNVAAPRLQLQISAHRSNFDRVTPGFHFTEPPMSSTRTFPAARLDLHSSSDASRFHPASARLDLHRIGVAWNVDHKFAGKPAWMSSALPLSHDPRRVALHIRADFERPHMRGVRLDPTNIERP